LALFLVLGVLVVNLRKCVAALDLVLELIARTRAVLRARLGALDVAALLRGVGALHRRALEDRSDEWVDLRHRGTHPFYRPFLPQR